MNNSSLKKFLKISIIAVGAAGIAAGISYCVDSKMPACSIYPFPAGYIKSCTIDADNDGKKDTDLEQWYFYSNDGRKIDRIESCEYEIGAHTPRKCGIDWNADGIVDQWDFPPGRESKGIFL